MRKDWKKFNSILAIIKPLFSGARGQFVSVGVQASACIIPTS
jgi:hypothetical protein